MAWIRGSLGIGLLVISTGCGRPEPVAPRVMPIAPIMAAAPRGIDDSTLGSPVDAHFRPLQGEIGKSLFPDAPVKRMRQSSVSHDAFALRDSLSLEANLAAWSIIDSSFGIKSDNRYAAYRAYQITSISSLDDRTEFDEAPPEAAFYVAKIYWGHAYEAVFEGERHALNAAVAANFPPVDARVGAYASDHDLRLHFTGSGLRPKTGDALFARSDQDVLTAYDTAGPAAPIFVEYRPVPNRPLPDRSEIAFDPALRVTVRFEKVRVLEDGSWFSTPWRLRAQCRVGGSVRSPSTFLLKGDSVDGGHEYTLKETLELVVTRGDTIECTADGSFSDTFAHGTIAPGRSKPIPVTGPATVPVTIEGHGETAYRISASAEIQSI